MRDIVAIGSTTLDTFWGTSLEEISYKKAPSGKALVLPFGEKFGAESLMVTTGGNAANAAITFARRCRRVSLVATVGDDATGREVLATLKKEDVYVGNVHKVRGGQTSQSALFLQNGERSILTYHGVLNDFSIFKTSALRAKWWYVSLPGKSYTVLDRLLAIARRYEIRVALNPSYHHLEGAGRASLKKHLGELAVLLVNDGEAARITGIPFSKEKEVFKKLDEMVPGIVVVTRGKKGVVVSDGAHIYRAGSFKEKKLIDRTGAGDAFGSGFITGLMETGELCKKEMCDPAKISYAIRSGSANATSVVERVGATAGILTQQQFEREARWKKLPIKIVTF